ncbi:DUF488 family protein [Alkanindiges sp. WGS2144]|uniref:DUF488 domain-containing protein n=1 Tax=Alkanindiges sp. WGS2144 TaxID=3366808 RepID=UPI00375042CF
MTAMFCTIGHSNRSLEEFLGMLQAAQVKLLVDVRTFPRSRSNPVFNIDHLPDDLARVDIGYQHCAGLGGRRPKQKDIDSHLNAIWRVSGFHNYADYALSDEFTAAFNALIALGQKTRLALMCSEAVWWRCHRRIITDYLLLNGYLVDHLLMPGRVDHAVPTVGAKRLDNGKVIYPVVSE